MNDREAFNEAVAELIEKDIADREERIKAVEALTDAYVDSTGQEPSAAQLERLTDYILLEEINDNSSDKVTQSEYPFFSDRQLERRYKRETTVKAAEYVGMDGRSHRAGKRRKRNKWETDYVDKNAKIWNAERKAQYKKDTAPGPVSTYYI
ncbi:hypothetical protein ABNC42_14930 [Paenibacillus larvae]